MNQILHKTKTMLALAALLGTAACSLSPGEEPLYVLRDSLGRAVALAGRSQLGDAPPGTMMRANIGGAEQNVMVGERVGRGSVLAPAQAAVLPQAEASAPAGEITTAPITSAPLAAPIATPVAAARAATPAVRSAANRPVRRRGPPAAALSRSVM